MKKFGEQRNLNKQPVKDWVEVDRNSMANEVPVVDPKYLPYRPGRDERLKYEEEIREAIREQ